MNGTYPSRSAAQTEQIGFQLAKALDALGRKRAVIAMRGEMGVGKTAFTRGFASYFGICGVKSPTYTIVNEYASPTAQIRHFDLYRITDADELYAIGFDDYLAKDGYCLLEWSENVTDELPDDRITVTLSRTDGADGREIRIAGF